MNETTTVDPNAMFEVPYSRLREMTDEIERLTSDLRAARTTIDEAFQEAEREREQLTHALGFSEVHREQAERKVRAVELVHVWTNDDGKRFMFADDVAVALEIPGAVARGVSS